MKSKSRRQQTKRRPATNWSLFVDIINGKAKKSTRLQELLTTALVILAVVGVGWFGTELVQPQIVGSPTVATVPIPEPRTKNNLRSNEMKQSAPLRLSIPRINLNAPIMKLGILEDGTMETPPVGVNLTGWYKYSPTPGEVGPSVIVGHVDDYDGPSVFWRLTELVIGDIVEVSRKDGSVAKFKVVKSTKYDQDDFPSDKVYGNINYPGLRLITCGGVFEYGKNRYSHNTVVYAELAK